MKKTVFLALLLMVMGTSIGIAQTIHSTTESKLTWHTDLMKADQLSKASNKPIFAFFTGSDWCGWCTKLHRDVFSKPEFVEWAQKNVVLLELDFPRRTPISPELAQQNTQLQQAFQVRGYPTIWLFYMENDKVTNNVNLATLGSLGYPQGAELGKEEVKFLSDANQILVKGRN